MSPEETSRDEAETDRFDSEENDSDNEGNTSNSDSEGEAGDDDDDDDDELVEEAFNALIGSLKFKSKKSKDDDRAKVEEQAAADQAKADKIINDFITDKPEYLERRLINKKNLLHMLAEAGPKSLPYKRIAALVEALIPKQGAKVDLLEQRDSDDKTPLYCAIFSKHDKLAKAMCQLHPDVDKVIGVKTKRVANALHLALQQQTSPKDDDLIKLLIQKSSHKTLCDKDENGLTPLHLAVDFSRCYDGHLDIVETLVNRCPAALDKTYNNGTTLLSPYRYLEATYQDALKKAAMEAKKRVAFADAEPTADGRQSGKSVKDGAPPRPRERPIDIAIPKVVQRAPSYYEPPPGKMGSLSSPKTPFPDSKSAPAVRPKTEAKGDGKSEPKLDADGKPSPSAPTAEAKPRKKSTKDDTKQSKKMSSKESKKSSKEEAKPTEESAMKIKQFLKLYYLRHKSHDDAVEFLYGVQQDRQIYFDLFGAAPTLKESRLYEGLSHLKFEDVLQYVAVPRVVIEGDRAVAPKGAKPLLKRNTRGDAQGRSDLGLLFKWLKDEKQKKVKTILKVIVDDLNEPAHHDEAIEECLDGLGVEVWDWRKMDLSPEIIKKVAPDVREIHLYWSGNNAVLRGWSEPEGLRQLQKLRKVYLHPHRGLESETRNKLYREAFKKRIQDAKERIEGNNKIEVIVCRVAGDPGQAEAAATDAVRDPYFRHRWITTMEEFADFLDTAKKNTEPEIQLKKPILVAVIDDGVDINDQAVQARIVGGRSFCYRDREQNLNQPYYVSSSGHGTAMAGMICKLCPDVRLYVLKLHDIETEPGKRFITAKSAAKAVRAAISADVDIISMSWTIERTEQNKADVDDLEQAIELAASKDILMFCAASDQGAFRDRSYPAASGTKKLFKIGAAEASGVSHKWVGDQSTIDFLMPGHQVVMERADDKRVTKFTPLTGSSVATALASGLAAVILYCVQVGGILIADGNPKIAKEEWQEYEALKTHERMKLAFQQIRPPNPSDPKYIEVWNRFDVKSWKDKEAKDRWILLLKDLAPILRRKN